MIEIAYSEPILECLYADSPCVSKDGVNFLITTTKDTWVFPWKTTCIDINTLVRLPDDMQGLIIGCPWIFEDNIYVYPHVVSDNMHVFVYVRKMGILPKKIQKGTIIARLIPVKTSECHLLTEQLEGQS